MIFVGQFPQADFARDVFRLYPVPIRLFTSNVNHPLFLHQKSGLSPLRFDPFDYSGENRRRCLLSASQYVIDIRFCVLRVIKAFDERQPNMLYLRVMTPAQRDQIVESVVLCEPERDNVMNVYILRCSAYRAELNAAKMFPFDTFEPVPPILRLFLVQGLLVTAP